MVDKVLTDISINSRLTGETRTSATLERRIPKMKRKKESLAMSPTRKYTITNQGKNNV